MCAFWNAADGWITLAGVVLVAFSGVIFALPAAYGHINDWHAGDVFRDLDRQSIRLGKAIAAAKVPKLLEGSEVVSEHLRDKLKGARRTLDVITWLILISHDLLRRDLDLDPQQLTDANGVLSPERIAASKREVDDEIQDLLDNPRPLRPRPARWAFVSLLIGSILTIMGAVPACQ